MNISSWSIKNPIPSIMLFVLLTLAGLYSFKAMKVQQFPDIDLPMVTVVTTLPGAAPNQLETEVARKIENAIATVQGVKNQYSRISDGLVAVTVEFRIEKPVQEALDDVRSAVAGVRGDLPSSVNEPIVTKVELAASPVLAYTITSKNKDTQALSWYTDNEITKLLLSVRGVGAVKRVGGVSREVTVELDPLRLQSLGATAADISRQLASNQIERAGGKAEVGGSDQPLRTLATVGDVEQLAAMQIALSDGRRIRLDQVAEVRDGNAKPTAAAFLNGKPVVGFEVVRSRGASDIEVGAGVRAKLKALQEASPDLEITESFDFVSPVQEDFDASMTLLYEGAVLAILVVFLFLRDWRATIVSAVALPLSAIPAFAGMYYMGFTINTVTLLSMSLVVGILVDDAIVEVENIVRHMRMGKSPIEASMEAADEIGLAVIATTATLIAVFLPTAFMTGVVGKFFVQFGWTAALAIFASLMVARLLTPMMAAYILKPLVDSAQMPAYAQKNRILGALWKWIHTHPDDPNWLQIYMKAVKWSITHRWTVMAISAVYLFASFALVGFIPGSFIPPDDNSQTQINIELPPGSTLAQTIKSAEAARLLVADMPTIKSVYTTIGSGAAGTDPFTPGVPEARKAALTIQLQARSERPRKQIVEGEIRERLRVLAGVRYKVGLGGGGGGKYQMALTGNDADVLVKTARAVERDLRTIEGIGNIESGAALVRTEVNVIPDFAKAADMGVTSAAIADTLRVATTGDYDSALSKLNLSERQIPIVVRLADSGLASLETLSRLAVPGSKGPVMLGQIAQLQFGGGPAVISRMNRERNINLNVELADLPLVELQNKVKELPSVQSLPPGVELKEIGDAEAQADMASGFALAMGSGILLIYIVLVLLFKTFLQPITILVALPLSFGGAFLALLLTGKLLAMPSIIGLLMLMGIATKNSILLVDYAIEEQRRTGMNRFDALLEACHKRARPIVMTSIAMGAGMLPIAMEWGVGDGSFRSPMAVAVIGGLISSTILSLLVVPPAYLLMDGAARRWRGLFGKKSVELNN